MLVKAKDLQVGDRIGIETIRQIIPNLYTIKVFCVDSNDWWEYMLNTDVAIYRQPMIMKFDGSTEPFSKEKLKRSIYKAILDLPEEEWDFGKVQSWVDEIAESDCIYSTEVVCYLVRSVVPRNIYESYNQQRWIM